MKTSIRYKELSKAKIQKQRNIVISSASKDGEDCGFTFAQQLEVEEGTAGKKTSVFMSGSIIVDGLQSLYNLRDAINVAIEKTERENINLK